MNLSALNTGLNPGPVHNAPEPNGPGQAALRLPPGTLSGEDFAAFLRNQVRALKNSQRPELAAAPVASPLPPPERPSAQASNKEDKPSADNRSSRMKSQDQTEARHTEGDTRSSDEHMVQRQQRLSHEASLLQDAQATQDMQDAGQLLVHDDVQTALSEDALSSLAVADQKLATQDPALANATELTTISLSPSINIITVAQTAPDEKSLSDFALAMGLDPNQVQALFGTAETTKTPISSVSTQQVLGMNGLPTVAAPAVPMDLPAPNSALTTPSLPTVAVATADFQAIKADAPVQADATLAQAIKTMDVLNMQVATGQPTAALATSAPPVSTLAVLSMMDTQLRPEDIEALKNEFDTVTAVDLGSSEHGLASGNQTGSNTHAASKAAAAFVSNPDMAQTFEKLSEKLATELAGRMHEKLNAGEWKMKFALKPASLGLVDVQLEMRDGKLTAQFNADTNLTQELIQSGSQRLKEALGQLGMNNASVLVGQGQSQQQGQASNSSNPSRQGDDNRVKLADESGVEPLVQAKPRHSNSLQFDNYA
jgi:flagellar hook-length control protein FliK